MDISLIKSLAWDEMDNKKFGFEFNGETITYPWLDAKRHSIELTTVQAIAEYGVNNIKEFCRQVALEAPTHVHDANEWAGGDPVTDQVLRAYNRWLENGVTYTGGYIQGVML